MSMIDKYMYFTVSFHPSQDQQYDGELNSPFLMRSVTFHHLTDLILMMDEIMESCNIIEQLIDNIPEGDYRVKTKAIIKLPEGVYSSSVEASRGEFCVILESHGDKYPYRLHFRSTGLPLVHAMDTACRNAKIADLIAIGGTLDFVIPDIDR